MTDTYQPLKYSKSELDPCDQEVFTFALQIGVVGAISLLVGGTGMIASSGQLDWDIARALYLALIVLGPIAILIAQKFLPDVSNGDKRVILVNGEPVGAINRVPQAGETRSNMHVGGRPEKVGLTARDLEICAAIGPTLRDHGQIFVGIDVIGDYLTEINVTSPTGIQELERFDGTNVAERIWQVIEAKRAG